MITALANHLWQSTIFMIAIGLLTAMCRKNHASVRHSLWFGASVKFLLPFALLVAVAGQLEWIRAQRVTTPAVATTLAHVSRPFAEGPAPAVFPVQAAARGSDRVAVTVVVIWVSGIVAMTIIRLRMWRDIRAVLRASSQWTIPDLPLPAGVEMRSSPSLMEPGVVGLWHPVLLIPSGIEKDLTPRQLAAVLAHELCHIRRRDNLTAAVHMIAETVFWFFPPVWWIGLRLVNERERACDEEVVRTFGEPQTYAEGILNVCKRYFAAPLTCVSGVSGSDVKNRIHNIMANRALSKLSVAKKVVLAGVATVVMVAPILAQSATRTLATQGRFEAASIKRTTTCSGLSNTVSPGRFRRCGALSFLIQASYDLYTKEHGFTPNVMAGAAWTANLQGAPAWLNSDTYEIEAKAEGNPSYLVMAGPMFQALLEDRLKLKVHWETKQVPVYEMTVAKGGPKLQPVKDENCLRLDPTKPPVEPPAAGEAPPKGCEDLRFGKGTLDVAGLSVSRFAEFLGRNIVVRPVIDKTGLEGYFKFQLQFAFDEATPMLRRFADGEVTGPSIFTAVQEQLGLKLEPATGPHDFLVIDSVERPSEN
jgi:bla regulator protein blaR1